MKFTPTAIPDILLIEPQVFGDERGFFMETYQQKAFAEAGITAQFVQDNQSGSRQGILRGLHYQIRQPQGKLVRTLVGEIFDVAVDIRKNSPTFGKWVGAILSSKNKHQLWVPAGFAHGFYVLSEWAEVAYKATDFYAPQFERSILWNDAELNIDWPILPGQTPLVSAKDACNNPFSQAEYFE
jgi:dTDP-4-dehydrorhamnose 3,5-epimerase